MPSSYYPGVNGEDQEHLSALASYNPPPDFESAYAGLSEGTPRDAARKAYDDFTAYWHPSAVAS